MNAMSQMGFAPRIGAKDIIIGAHADHRTADYFFPRTQSLESRDLPWENRLKPVHSYGELAIYTAAVVIAASLALSFI
jgi:hypothetical protein